jgi:hypothetical protein
MLPTRGAMLTRLNEFKIFSVHSISTVPWLPTFNRFATSASLLTSMPEKRRPPNGSCFMRARRIEWEVSMRVRPSPTLTRKKPNAASRSTQRPSRVSGRAIPSTSLTPPGTSTSLRKSNAVCECLTVALWSSVPSKGSKLKAKLSGGRPTSTMFHASASSTKWTGSALDSNGSSIRSQIACEPTRLPFSFRLAKGPSRTPTGSAV